MKHKTTFIGAIVSLLIITSCGVNFEALKKEENKYNLSTTEQLTDSIYASRIEDFYNGGTEGSFEGKDSVKIYYKTFRQKQSGDMAIVISAGRTEAAIKYKELIFDLYNNGYSVYIHDHRGQGLSGRMIENTDMGYIDDFQYYIDDMKFFYDNIVKKGDHDKIYLLAHSMGGAIGMTYLEQNSGDFVAAAFSSPMLGLVPPGCSTVKLFHLDKNDYAMGESKYHDDKVAFKDNKLTGSEIRYKRMNSAFAKVPDAKLGGASYHWVYKSCKQFDYINSNINNIQTPFILFSAENEQIVDPKAHQQFVDKAKKLGKNCKGYLVKNAQHELLIEKDEQRIEVISKILDFYKNIN
ncbi:MAG: alpha/beta fold hydrolase [Bacteroidota bacterium]